MSVDIIEKKDIKSLSCVYNECGFIFTSADPHYYHEETDVCYCSEGCYEAEAEAEEEAEKDNELVNAMDSMSLEPKKIEDHIDKNIKIIQKYIKIWNKKINNLPSVEHNDFIINYKSINFFNISSKDNNDDYNKNREIIICNIINNKIDSKYYKYSPRWRRLKNALDIYLDNLCKKNNINNNNNISCKINAGRNNSNDFTIIINEEAFVIEFKYNARNVKETPQFVSPMKPSQYLDMNFEEWYYDNYIPKIVAFDNNLDKPNREEYLKHIHNNKVECMKHLKELYDSNQIFKKHCQKIDKEAIHQFIEMTNINYEKLSEYLLKGQKNKIYMCYGGGNFYYDNLDESLYKIINLEKKENTNYICITEKGMKLEIKLRFKNGCGLQFPAFQIKRRIPSIKELQLICQKNNIKLSCKLKKDICKILDENNIIY